MEKLVLILPPPSPLPLLRQSVSHCSKVKWSGSLEVKFFVLVSAVLGDHVTRSEWF